MDLFDAAIFSSDLTGRPDYLFTSANTEVLKEDGKQRSYSETIW